MADISLRRATVAARLVYPAILLLVPGDWIQSLVVPNELVATAINMSASRFVALLVLLGNSAAIIWRRWKAEIVPWANGLIDNVSTTRWMRG